MRNWLNEHYFNDKRKAQVRFKTSKARLILCIFLCGFTLHSVATENLSALNAPQFALGMVGFAGRITEAEVKMNEIISSGEGEAVFVQIIESPNESLVAKLYSLCGLKKISSKEFNRLFDLMSRSEGQVSVIYGDVMSRDTLTQALEKVKYFRCGLLSAIGSK